jgi:hypothetical protein
MALTDSEVESLRFFLGWGNLNVRAYPYTPDGWWEALYGVVRENLTEGAETTASVAIAAAGIVTVTPTSMTDIVTHARLVIDVGDDEETVTVRATTATTFSARFALAHAAPFAICVESGVTRCRQLLAKAYAVLSTIVGSKITSSAGLKMVGQGEVEWFGPSAVLTATGSQLDAIRRELSSLVRIPLREEYEGECRGPVRMLETY